MLTVQSARGPVQVLLNTDTRILLGESGLTLAAIRTGEKAVGHTIQVQGGLDRGTGRMVADVLVVGPKAPR